MGAAKFRPPCSTKGLAEKCRKAWEGLLLGLSPLVGWAGLGKAGLREKPRTGRGFGSGTGRTGAGWLGAFAEPVKQGEGCDFSRSRTVRQHDPRAHKKNHHKPDSGTMTRPAKCFSSCNDGIQRRDHNTSRPRFLVLPRLPPFQVGVWASGALGGQHHQLSSASVTGYGRFVAA